MFAPKDQIQMQNITKFYISPTEGTAVQTDLKSIKKQILENQALLEV